VGKLTSGGFRFASLMELDGRLDTDDSLDRLYGSLGMYAGRILAKSISAQSSATVDEMSTRIN
jgi:hypothetical protein